MRDGERGTLPFEAVGHYGHFDGEFARERDLAVAADMRDASVAQDGGVAEGDSIDGAGDPPSCGERVEAVVVDAVGGEDDGTEVGAFIEFGNMVEDGGEVGLRFGEGRLDVAGRGFGNGLSERVGDDLVVAGEVRAEPVERREVVGAIEGGVGGEADGTGVVLSDDDERLFFFVADVSDERREEKEAYKRNRQEAQYGENESYTFRQLRTPLAEGDIVEKGGKESARHKAEKVEIPGIVNGEVHWKRRLDSGCKVTKIKGYISNAGCVWGCYAGSIRQSRRHSRQKRNQMCIGRTKC